MCIERKIMVASPVVTVLLFIAFIDPAKSIVHHVLAGIVSCVTGLLFMMMSILFVKMWKQLCKEEDDNV